MIVLRDVNKINVDEAKPGTVDLYVVKPLWRSGMDYTVYLQITPCLPLPR